MMKLKFYWAFFALAIFVPFCTSNANAACSGSNPTWTSTPDISSVQACINSAGTGSTINVTAGSATWSTGPKFPNDKAINLVGAGIDATTITLNDTINLYCGTGKPHTLSGFTFTGSTVSRAVTVNGTCAGFRIHHNKFENFSINTDVIAVDMFLQGQGSITGLIDNNIFTALSSNFRAVVIVGTNTDNWPTSPVGTANTIFIEDNTLDFGDMTNAGAGCIDSNYTGHYVWRFNKSRNCLVTAHGVCNAPGTVSIEVYDNNLTANGTTWNDGTRLIHHQGSGEMYVFDNRFTASAGKSGSALSVTHYRSCPGAQTGCNSYPRCDGTASIDQNTSGQQGYACFHQPGRNGAGALTPIYLADNLWTDSSAALHMTVENPWSCSSPDPTTHVKPNRDYYDEQNTAQTSPTSPFNGTSGTGWGTLANRPTTCTAGVGYWATDSGSWNKRPGGSEGQLYECTATNTWSVHYTPYTYPHPLQGFASATGPNPPTNLLGVPH